MLEKVFQIHFIFFILISLFGILLIIIRLIKMLKILYKGIKCEGNIYKITQEYFRMKKIEFGYTYEDQYYYNNVKISIDNLKYFFKEGDTIEVFINKKDNSEIFIKDIFLK